MDVGTLGGAVGAVLVGNAGGGVLRLVPEFLKIWDRKGERAHELAMMQAQTALEATKSAEQLAVINAQQGADVDVKEIEALMTGVAAQGGKTGLAWADGLNAAVRPVLTLYWGVVLYSAVILAKYIVLVGAGSAAAEAVLQLWGAPEYALLGSMFSFWFVDRALRKGGGVGSAH